MINFLDLYINLCKKVFKFLSLKKYYKKLINIKDKFTKFKLCSWVKMVEFLNMLEFNTLN